MKEFTVCVIATLIKVCVYAYALHVTGWFDMGQSFGLGFLINEVLMAIRKEKY